MPADFVPFVSSLAGRVAIHNQPAALSPLVSADAATPTACDKREIKVELKREGERITQIRIHCRCGEVIELDCQY